MSTQPFTQAEHARLFGAIAARCWYDVTGACPDKEAVQCYGIGFKKARTVYLLARYEPAELMLVVMRGDDDYKSIPAAQWQLQWLWEQIEERSREH